MKDISNNDDIKLLVDTFYSRAKKDELLGPIFEEHIEDWDVHHIKLYQFWRTVILKQAAYSAKLVQMHFKMHLAQTHFDKWLEVWKKTVDDLFEGENAFVAKYRGEKMADSFLAIIERHK